MRVDCPGLNADAILIALLVMVIPGAGASLALHRPGQAGIPTRLALCFGLGYAVCALCGVVLVILHVLHPWTYVPLLAVVTVVLWAVPIRREGLRAHAAALRAEFAATPWLEALGLAALVVFALVRLRFSPLLNFRMFGPWRYWADGMEIADAGRVPHQTLQWGAAYTPTVSKVILNSYRAGMSYLIGSAPLPAMGALLWLASVGLACGLYGLGRELGLRRLAILLPLLMLVLVENQMKSDLDVYTAENTGRLAAVCALLLGVRVLRGGSGRSEPIAVRGRGRQPRHPGKAERLNPHPGRTLGHTNLRHRSRTRHRPPRSTRHQQSLTTTPRPSRTHTIPGRRTYWDSTGRSLGTSPASVR